MKSFTIILNTVEKVKDFCDTINKFDGEFDLISDNYIIDAKSIMSILSLDLSKPMTFQVNNVPNLKELENSIKNFM